MIAQNSPGRLLSQTAGQAKFKTQNHSSKLKTKLLLGLLRDDTQIDKDKINEFLKETEEISKCLAQAS